MFVKRSVLCVGRCIIGNIVIVIGLIAPPEVLPRLTVSVVNYKKTEFIGRGRAQTPRFIYLRRRKLHRERLKFLHR